MPYTYNIYAHPTKGSIAVRLGFAWPAIFLGCFWMFSNVLWRRGLIWLTAYTILWGLALILLNNAQGWLQTMGFIKLGLAFLTLWLLPAFFGHLWCELHLHTQGFERRSIEYANCAQHAVRKAKQKYSSGSTHQLRFAS